MALIDDIYSFIAPTHLIYIRMTPNALEIKHIKSGNTLTRKAETPFSNERLLITDPLIAEPFTKSLIAELLNSKKKLLDRKLTVVLQPMHPAIEVFTPVEQMIFQDFAYQIGGKCYFLVDHSRRLTDEEVTEITKMRTKKGNIISNYLLLFRGK